MMGIENDLKSVSRFNEAKRVRGPRAIPSAISLFSFVMLEVLRIINWFLASFRCN